MSKIHSLSPALVAKIAAGEVIERPAYVVKELIDNAIDAGARYIRVDIEKSGLEKITVTDDGEGMSKEDLEVCFHRHTTSKISEENDLYSVKSMGFRGEALASIAAISSVTINSKLRGAVSGYSLQMRGGKLESISPIGISEGTTVIVEHVFHNVPARQKFLKSPATEFRHITQMVMNAVLAYPQVRFFLTHNDKTVLLVPVHCHPDADRDPSLVGTSVSINRVNHLGTLPVDPDLRRDDKKKEQKAITSQGDIVPYFDRIRFLFGQDFTKHLVPVVLSDGHISLSGLISKPHFSTHASNKQYLFVNSRCVKNKVVSQAVREAYGTLLPPEQQPIFFLYLQFPYEMVDVNVHPRKEEVHFYDNDSIYHLVKEAISQSLKKNNLTFQDARWQRATSSIPENLMVRDGGTKTYAAQVLKEDVLGETKEMVEILKSSDFLQLHNLYIVAQTKKGFLLIDQHAAHERVLYERFSEAFKKRKHFSEQYDLPSIVQIQLSAVEVEVLKEHMEEFEAMGFGIEEADWNIPVYDMSSRCRSGSMAEVESAYRFQSAAPLTLSVDPDLRRDDKNMQEKTTKKNIQSSIFNISAVPVLFKDRNIPELIREMIDDLMQEKALKEVDLKSHRMLTYLACRSAIKAGEKLTKDQMRNLVEELEKTPNKFTCPHGRPTQIEVSMKELGKMFGR